MTRRRHPKAQAKPNPAQPPAEPVNGADSGQQRGAPPVQYHLPGQAGGTGRKDDGSRQTRGRRDQKGSGFVAGPQPHSPPHQEQARPLDVRWTKWFVAIFIAPTTSSPHSLHSCKSSRSGVWLRENAATPGDETSALGAPDGVTREVSERSPFGNTTGLGPPASVNRTPQKDEEEGKSICAFKPGCKCKHQGIGHS